MAEDAVVVDGMGRTSVPAVFAAGDTTAEMPSVASAIAAGHRVAAVIVHDLM
jgi:thioredoxin reductase